jgi:hypothetical protein
VEDDANDVAVDCGCCYCCCDDAGRADDDDGTDGELVVATPVARQLIAPF